MGGLPEKRVDVGRMGNENAPSGGPPFCVWIIRRVEYPVDAIHYHPSYKVWGKVGTDTPYQRRQPFGESNVLHDMQCSAARIRTLGGNSARIHFWMGH